MVVKQNHPYSSPSTDSQLLSPPKGERKGKDLNRVWQVFFLLSMIACFGGLTAGAQTRFTSIDQMTGWKACSDCANGRGVAPYSMTQGLTSPALDGRSTQFWIGGT